MPDTHRSLAGFHAVTARLRASPQSIHEIFVASARKDARARELAERAAVAGIRVHHVDEARLDALVPGVRHQGVVARVDAALGHVTLADLLDSPAEAPLFLVLDGVTDPHNLGACLRSADAFGAHAVVVPKDRSAGLSATVAKAASGAAETVPLVSVTNLARALREMKEAGVWVVGADAGGENIYDAQLDGPLAWVLGAEGPGLRRLTRESCDRVVGIPLHGQVESLNVSVTAGICLFATRRARYIAAR